MPIYKIQITQVEKEACLLVIYIVDMSYLSQSGVSVFVNVVTGKYYQPVVLLKLAIPHGINVIGKTSQMFKSAPLSQRTVFVYAKVHHL